MKLFFKKGFPDNTQTLLRKCGYRYTRQYKGEPGFARRVGRSQYPQFHIYINEDSQDRLVLNLHLDAKKPSYPGMRMHSGEYDTEVVKQEAERVKRIIKGLK